MIGGDKAGQAFASGYEPARRQIEDAAEHGVKVLIGVSLGVVTMADYDEALDEANARPLKPHRSP